MKISLGMCTRGEVLIETMRCVLDMLNNAPHQFHLNFHKGTYLYELRNNMVEEARRAEADYLFFVDSDVVFPPDGLEKLLSHDKDVVGGVYNMKQIPLVSTLKLLGPDGKFISGSDVEIPNHVFEVGALPTGFMLIKLSSIAWMDFPFDFHRNPETREFTGEDVNFCKRCREHGMKVWCDPTIKIGHIGDYVY